MISQISELNRVAARSQQLEQRVTELQGQVDHYRRICTASSSASSSGGRGAGGRRVHSVGAVGSFTVPAVSTTHCHRSLVLSPSPLFSSLLLSCPLGVAKTQERAVTERCSAQLRTPTGSDQRGARRQGALAPQLPRATRSPKFQLPFLGTVFRAVCGCLGGCDAFVCAAIAALTTPSKTPKKHIFFKIGGSSHKSTYQCVDPNCVVKEEYFRGVLHCFGRGKTRG